MEQTREALRWSANKIVHDPLTFLLSVYVLGFFPALAVGAIATYGEHPVNALLLTIEYAALWPYYLARWF
jgi:hypothetical protein